MQLPLFYDDEKPDDLKNLKIYRSSAGSGKTFTLVKDYLKLVLKDPDNFKRILAITFTNKATEELRKEILKELGSLSHGTMTSRGIEIEKEFREENLNIPIQKRASVALGKILHNYGQLGISTLDHFFAQVVRGFARELDLPLKYDIDVDEERAIDYAIEELYQDIDNDVEIRSWLEDFAYSRIDEDKGWNIDYNLKELGKELFEENFHKGSEGQNFSLGQFKDFVEGLRKFSEAFGAQIKKLARSAMNKVESSGLNSSDFHGARSRSWILGFQKILEGRYVLTDAFLGRLLGTAPWYTASSIKAKKIEELRDSGLGDLCLELAEFYASKGKRYLSIMALLKNIYSYGILDLLNEKLKAYRREKNLVLLSDNAFLLNEFIDDRDTPIIYEKIGARYRHVLIDEFQDTSIYQWSNVLPVVRHALSELGEVLVVGDVKQSIYRWRGGEMKLLISGVIDDLAQFRNQTIEKKLNRNWRSARNIVEFNNQFFKSASAWLNEHPNNPQESDLIAKTYEAVEQIPQKKEEGYIEIQFFESDDNSDWKERSLNRMVEAVENSLANNYKPGEILILVDKWDLGYEAAEVLIAKGHKVITDNSLQVQNNSTVQLLVNAIKWLNDVDNQLAKTNLLFLYLESNQKGKYNAHDIFRDIHNEGRIFQEVMPEYFLKNLRVFLRLPLYELVENLIFSFKLERQIDNFVLRFLDICLEQSTRGKSDLPSFLEWWEEMKKDLVVITPETDDSIWIMTFHKAKGLESPVVIMPFAVFDLNTKYNSIFWTTRIPKAFDPYRIMPLSFEKGLMKTDFEEAYRHEFMEGMLEALNVTYVGFTRAQQILYVFSERVKEVGDGNKLNKLMWGILDQEAFAFNQYWDNGKGKFIWGEENIKAPERKDREKIEELQDFISVPAFESIKIKAESQRFFMLFDNSKSAKIRRGILLHRIFEVLPDQEMVKKVIKDLAHNGLIHFGDMQELESQVNEILKITEVEPWFNTSWKIYTERPIFTTDKILRPDRVMMQNGEAIVVDYKLGKEDQSHHKQVNQYAELLKKMGIQKVRKYLLYFESNKVVEVN